MNRFSSLGFTPVEDLPVILPRKEAKAKRKRKQTWVIVGGCMLFSLACFGYSRKMDREVQAHVELCRVLAPRVPMTVFCANGCCP